MAFIMQQFRTPNVVSIFMIVFILLAMSYAEARPSWTNYDKKYGSLYQCEQDNDLMELCQRCAKATKSRLAYPMCCTNMENATYWCKEFLFFGIHN